MLVITCTPRLDVSNASPVTHRCASSCLFCPVLPCLVLCSILSCPVPISPVHFMSFCSRIFILIPSVTCWLFSYHFIFLFSLLVSHFSHFIFFVSSHFVFLCLCIDYFINIVFILKDTILSSQSSSSSFSSSSSSSSFRPHHRHRHHCPLICASWLLTPPRTQGTRIWV